MAKRKNNNSSGGLKGFFTKASNSFFTGGTFVKDQSFKLSVALGKYGFIFATTCIVMFVPLVFEIAREGQVSKRQLLLVLYFKNSKEELRLGIGSSPNTVIFIIIYIYNNHFFLLEQSICNI